VCSLSWVFLQLSKNEHLFFSTNNVFIDSGILKQTWM
jgi:hypothetical protein